MVKVDFHKNVLPKQVAGDISDMFAQQTRRSKYPAPKDIRWVLHGTSYTFISWLQGEGSFCGAAVSPDDGTSAAQLVSLTDVLFRYAKADSSKRPSVLEDLNKVLSELKSKRAS